MDKKSNEQLQKLRTEVISAGVSSVTPLHVASARGAIVRDVEGREYIDFGGGIGVMNIGHCHPRVVAAIKAQAEKFHHTCFMVSPYEVAITLAEKLCRITPGQFPKKAMFVNSGAEAVENAVKIARAYTKRPAVIVFDNAYHGRTLLTMTMTSKVKPYKLGFGPFAPEVYRMPFGDTAGPEKLKEIFVKHVNPEAVACVVAEPVQGEGGFITPPPGYFQELARICRDNGIVFVADEIQSGMGRTGKMFAIEHWEGVEPDLVTVAKSLGAGMPIAGVVGRREIMDAVHPWGLGRDLRRQPGGLRGGARGPGGLRDGGHARQGPGPREEAARPLRGLRPEVPARRLDPRHRRHAGAGAREGRAAGAGGGRGQEARRLLSGARPHHPGVRHLQQRHPRAGAVRDHGRRAREGPRDPRAGHRGGIQIKSAPLNRGEAIWEKSSPDSETGPRPS